MDESRSDFYSNFYHSLNREGIQGWGNSIIDKLIERNAKRQSGQRILEIGASSGEHLQFVNLDPAWSEYIALDISPGISNPKLYSLLSSSEKSPVPNIRFIEANAEQIPYPDGYFDLVISTCLLAHVRSPERVIREVRRVVRDQGQVIFAMPCDPGFINRVIKKFITFPKMRSLGIENPNYENSREHRNGIHNLIIYLKYFFSNDCLRLKFFPFAFPSWNFNLVVIANCIVRKI